jgi:type IX secretion system PorP/SprF family membrane protein
MKKKWISMLFFIVMLNVKSFGQDPHFTQYFASPLTLNPAQTGFFDGDYRIAVNERQQWWNVGANYNTTSIAADFKIMKNYIPEFDTFGLGFSGIFDTSLNGALQSNYLSVSGAYHKNLASAGSQTLAVGFQLNFADRYINFNKLSFASQFNVDFFDTTIPVNIDYNSSDTKYIELNTGILYAVHLDNSNIYLGASLFHATKPKETLFSSSGYTVPFRETINMGGEVNISSQSSFLFSGVYMKQANLTDQLFGGAYAIKANNNFNNLNPFKLYVGFWYRLNDSYIPYLGVTYNNIDVGLNYSIPASPIFSYQPRTLELSLIYKHKSKTALCPRF